MNLSIGIVGLPNVGKSTLFNALLKKQVAFAANYPFATIEPNVGIVEVPDERLSVLAKVVNTTKIVPAAVEFYDIAGLVKGASEGQGLGNKFLAHIREVKLIAHVVRVFEDPNVIKEGTIDPKSDYETIRTELQLADLQTLSKMNEKTLRTEPEKQSAVSKLKASLNEGKNAYEVELTDEETSAIKELNLLTAKKELIVLNVSEEQYNEASLQQLIHQYSSLLNISTDRITVISAKIEAELAELSPAEQQEYLKQLGVTMSGLERLIKKSYEELGLISFLTAGEKEVRAWTIEKGTLAPQAAATIHTDFEKHFIKADVIPFQEFVNANGWVKAREQGKVQIVGKDYIMRDGNVVEFKVNV